ncbi:MAG: two-component regulator propeller domain-containing protein [Bacteroidota bacterium]
MVRATVFFGVSILAAFSAFAQPQHPNFFHYNSDAYLISDQVLVIDQDHLGYIWVGTDEGLSKFSYNHVEEYVADRTDPNSLLSNRVRDLLVDTQGQVWVATTLGISQYDLALNHFKTIAIQGEPTLHVHALFEDADGQIWAGTEKGLGLYSSDSQSVGLLSVNLASRPGAAPAAVTAIAQAPDKSLWLGVGNTILRYMDGQAESIPLPQNTQRITSLTFDVEGQLWVGTIGGGLLEVEPDAQEVVNQYTSQTASAIGGNQVLSVIQTKKGALWVGTTNGVSVRWNGKEDFVTYEHDINDNYGLSDYVVTDIFQDAAGGIWLGTEAGGITYFHEADNLIEFYGPASLTGSDRSLADYHVRSLFQDAAGKVWLGSRVGLSCYERDQQEFTHFPISKGNNRRVHLPVLSIAESALGVLWVGTEEGLGKFNVNSGSYQLFTPSGAVYAGDNPQQINDLYVGEEGGLWMATENLGLLLFNTEYEQFLNPFSQEGQGYPREAMYSLVPDHPRAVLWIGGAAGLMSMPLGQDEYQLEKLYIGDSLVSIPPIIKSLTLDQEGVLWAGTQEQGLWRIDPESMQGRQYGEEAGLTFKDIRALEFDDSGTLWVTSNAGMARVEITDDLELLTTYFDVGDNLQGEKFFARSGIQSADGLMYFGGVNGLNVFDPSQIRDFQLRVPVAVNGLMIQDQAITLGDDSGILPKQLLAMDSIRLAADQNTFTLLFSNLDFVRPSDVVYQYQLVGWENAWKDGGNTRQVTYANLPRGRYYQFRLRAKNNLGQWTEAKPLTIYLVPAYWETLWFRLLLGVLVVVVIYLGYQVRTLRIRRKNDRLATLVEKSTQALQAEIKERIRTEHALTIAKDAAEIANRVKSEFLANMSHEIRTPLNGIIGLTGIVLSTPLSDDQNQYLVHVKQSADSLLRMVDDLLDFARLEAGQLKFVKEPFTLHEVLEEVLAGFRYEARQKGLRFEGELDSAMPRQLIGDKSRIQQVLMNLLANAFKFTDRGSVRISIEPASRKVSMDSYGVQFSVADTGVGIPKEKQQEIFDDFTQADNSTTRKYGGTGMGLALCRELISQMRGEIWVESKVKEGSTFYFYLPLEEVGTPILPATKKVSHSLTKPLLFEPNRVLVVEDNAVNQLVVLRLLRKVGLTAEVAQNGKEALDKLAEEKEFAMILMDLHMPEMDGYEAARRIRNGELDGKEMKNIPIVAVTAAARKVDEERCRNLGMNDFLTKPIHPPSLYEVLKRFLPSSE